MTLHAVGDAMGFHNNTWETILSGREIHNQLKQLGGVDNLKLNPSKAHLDRQNKQNKMTINCFQLTGVLVTTL